MPICSSSTKNPIPLLPLDWLTVFHRRVDNSGTTWNAFPGFDLLQKAIQGLSTAQLLEFPIANCNESLAMAEAVEAHPKQVKQVNSDEKQLSVLPPSSRSPKNTSQIADVFKMFHVLKL